MDFIHNMSAQDLGALITGSLGVVGIGVWWVLEHHVLKNHDKVEEAIDDAHFSVIELLRQEVERMASSNKNLGIGLAQFQAENLELRHEIANLHDIIGHLSERINTLTRATLYCNVCGKTNEINPKIIS